MPHQSDSRRFQPERSSSVAEYILVFILAAMIMIPTWAAIWWLLP